MKTKSKKIKAWAVLFRDGSIALYKDGFAAICDWDKQKVVDFQKKLSAYTQCKVVPVEIKILSNGKRKKSKTNL